MILTDEEALSIIKSIDEGEQFIQPALKQLSRAIESAVLAKLAGMELPEPDGILYEYKARHGKPFSYYTADQLRQAYAQGAASQLAETPLFFYRPTCNGEMYEGPHHASSIGGRMLREEKPTEWVPLFTRKEQP